VRLCRSENGQTDRRADGRRMSRATCLASVWDELLYDEKTASR
jgi:hypothetical protein